MLRLGVRRGDVRACVAASVVVAALVLVNGLSPWGPADADSPAVAAPPPAAPVRAVTAASPATAPVTTVPAPETPRLDGEAVGAGTPVRITVPRLGVDSAVLPISGESGVLEPPSDPLELGWWQEGAPPGSARGTTVMTGHTVHTGGGALDHLADLTAGDVVMVETDGGRVRYEVRSAWVLSKPELAERAVDLFAQDRPGRLVLVTCFDWNGSEYLSNAVVSALPVGSRRQ